MKLINEIVQNGVRLKEIQHLGETQIKTEANRNVKRKDSTEFGCIGFNTKTPFSEIPGVKETLLILKRNDEGHNSDTRKQLILQTAKIFGNSFAFINCGLKAIQDFENFLSFYHSAIHENHWNPIFAEMNAYIELVHLFNRTGRLNLQDSIYANKELLGNKKNQFDIQKVWIQFFRNFIEFELNFFNPNINCC